MTAATEASALSELTATDVAAAIRDGSVTAEDVVRACLERIAAVEDRCGAWAFFDPGHALAQARLADAARRDGRPLGPLHGVPVGIKDIFDTRDMPTEYGTPLHAGRRPSHDAAVVSLLRESGAIVMGKTVTTELAVYAPGKTRNPRNPDHTPGGSSSGSAAAVAANMVPLAIGSQTNGSTIRPASYCGVYGFKPTFGRISRHGCLAQSRPLDQVGLFARSIEDIALLSDVLIVHDPRDPDMVPAARPQIAEVAGQEPPVTPRIGFARTPVWDEAEDQTRAAFQELVEVLEPNVEDVALSEPFDQVIAWHKAIMEADLAKSFASEYGRGADVLSTVLREMIEQGRAVLAVDYNRAVDWITVMNGLMAEAFEWNDALLTPATPGPAPAGLGSTGNPVFCTLWTYLGTPALSMPLFEAEGGLPFGAQLVGPRNDDGRLLRTARWLVRQVQG